MAVCRDSFVNNGVEIRHCVDLKGRGLFTTRPFKEGEKILEEEPLVSAQFSWNAAYGYAACGHCMRPLETAEENARRLTGKPELVLPYPECDETDKNRHVICPHCALPYCNEDCKERAWNQYHKTLCSRALEGNANQPLEKLNEAWKAMHYPPETTSIMLIARILATLIQSSEKADFRSRLMALCHRTVSEEDAIAHKLLGKEFESQLEQLRDLTAKTFQAPEVAELLTADGFRSLFALIGRNGQGIGTSSFSVWVRKVTDLKPNDTATDEMIDQLYDLMDKESGDFLNNEGSALYAVQSACNHSCQPNSTSTFPYSDHRLVLLAATNLNAGEEVTISYLDECALTRSRHSRRKILQENYLFNCACNRCTADLEAGQPDVTSSEEEDGEESMDADDCC